MKKLMKLNKTIMVVALVSIELVIAACMAVLYVFIGFYSWGASDGGTYNYFILEKGPYVLVFLGMLFLVVPTITLLSYYLRKNNRAK